MRSNKPQPTHTLIYFLATLLRSPKLCLCTLLFASSAVHANEKTNLTRVGDFFHRYTQFAAIGYTYYNHGFEGALGCTAGSLLNNDLTTRIKRTVNEPRPNGGDLGFPSGHTSRVASSFGCLLGQEGLTVPTMALGAATAITAYSRVEGDYHTPKQVLAGAVLGATLGYLGTQHLSISPTEVSMTIPLGYDTGLGPAVPVEARTDLITFANDR